MKRSVQPNLVIVSDLHLGLPQYAGRSHAFAAWLDALAARRMDERPWRLILAGDIFEFLHMPPPGDHSLRARSPDLDIARRKWCELLPTVKPALLALGRFVRAGHEVHFTIGNHDRELMFRPIRSALVRALGLPRHLSAKVIFHPWFYAESGRVHVEHGHQFDEFSSYSELLEPHSGWVSGAIDEPVSHQAVRYFIYGTEGLLHPEDGEKWGFFQFIRWGTRVGARRCFVFLGMYLSMLWRMVRNAASLARSTTAEPTSRVVRVLAGHTRRYQVELAGLLALRRFWHPPAGPVAVLQCFFGDRIVLVLTALMVMGLLVALLGARWETAFAVFGVLVAVAGAWWALERARSTDQHPRLVRAAVRVRNTLRVPIVVFGHSHVPARMPLPGGDGHYLNPGGWADPAETEPGAVVLRRGADGSLSLVTS